MRYRTGDYLLIWPINPEAEVNSLLQILSLTEKRDIPLSIGSLDAAVKMTVPSPAKPASLLRYYLETTGIVSRDALRSLATVGPMESARIFVPSLFPTQESYAVFRASRPNATLSAILSLASDGAPCPDLPVSFLLEMLLVMQPRYYSISSSAASSPKTMSTTISINHTGVEARSQPQVTGLCTSYLQTLSNSPSNSSCSNTTHALNGPNDILANAKVFAQIRKSKFKLPGLASHPIIMVAAGAGIAPSRAFITERARLAALDKPVGRMLLFFGCRSRSDFLYHDEFEHWQNKLNVEAEILIMVTAYSREVTTEKRYVQQRVIEHGQLVCDMLDENRANFYVCGSAGMDREVGRAVERSFTERGWSEATWKGWIDLARSSRRWQDVWG